MSASGGERRRKAASAPAFLALALVLGGCQARYLLEQGLGQWRMSRSQVPLDSPALAASLDEEARRKLEWVPRILAFAREELGLEPGDSYTTFLDTGERPVSYIVTAAHPLALVAYQWCFPWVGCVPYKGYFEREKARAAAESLRRAGWDAEVFPVGAYSTLGWFRDPVLSTMLARDLLDLVEVILHETTHRTLYVPGSATFNESLATHVAREGTRLFIERHPEAADGAAIERYEAARRREELIDGLTSRLRHDLAALYQSPLATALKQERKEEIFATAAAAAGLLGASGAVCPRSNAQLLAAERYHQLLPAFARLQEEKGGHPSDLMAYLKRLLSEEKRLPEGFVAPSPRRSP
jgi:predicted aminopeptidase